MCKDILMAKKILKMAESATHPHAIMVLGVVGRNILEGAFANESLSVQDKNLIFILKASYCKMLVNKLYQLLNTENFESFEKVIALLTFGFQSEIKVILKESACRLKCKRLYEIFPKKLTALGLAASSLTKNNHQTKIPFVFKT